MATHLISPFRSRSLTSLLRRLRPLATIATPHPTAIHPRATAAALLSTQATSSSLNDPNPNWQNRPPKETILLDGCDFEHWLVVMEKPEGDPTRDEIIDKYIKTLSQVVGSEEEARMKIYSVSTRCYYAFGALVSEELSYKLKELPGVRWVLPDSYLDVKNKDYGGEPFINGQAVPYDPKYHEEWIRNNARANERNRRNDRPRNFDRSRNFERRDNMRNQGMQNAGANMAGAPPNRGPPPPNNMGGSAPPPPAPNNMGGGAPPPPPNNWGAGPNNMGGGAPPQPNNWGGAPNRGPQPPNNWGGAPNNMGPPPPNNWGGAPNNMGPPPANNWGGAPINTGGGGAPPPPPNNWGGAPPPPQNSWGGAPPNQQGYAPNNNMGNMPGGNPHSA